MRMVCVARHRFLSEHFCRTFDGLGIDTIPGVGVAHAASLMRSENPDAVVCDYDLLATSPAAAWARDPILSRIPIIAVSLTRQPGDGQVEASGIAGFLYLPTLQPEDAHCVLAAVRRTRGIPTPPRALPWPGQTQAPQLR